MTGAEMEKRQIRRITRELTEAENTRLQKYREQIAQELPDLQARDQMRKDARDAATLSGELRRAIHASELSLAEIAARIGVTPIVLDDFLTGERTLRSDVLDRLAGVLGYELQKAS
jgi:plasmid maintenance system antidote protein VapI